ncbi:MAG TPA: hypothetical protein VEN30_09145, partial [Paraburkholderia sp.]|nr:hypothetical protein [Paraburkholderia sp.]
TERARLRARRGAGGHAVPALRTGIGIAVEDSRRISTSAIDSLRFLKGQGVNLTQTRIILNSDLE